MIGAIPLPNRLPSWEFYGKRTSAHAAVSKENLQLAEYEISILTSGTPALHDPLRRQIEHSSQRIAVGKTEFVLGDLPELTVQALDDISRVYDFPDLKRVFKERTQNFPVILTALDTGGRLFAPGIEEPEQVLFRLVQGNGSVDLLQIADDLLMIFPYVLPFRIF